MRNGSYVTQHRRDSKFAWAALSILCVVGIAACGDDSSRPAGFVNASASQGGALYDSWWAAAGVAEPTGDHPLWASRPDKTSNTRSGSTTWRCKECHGWDYKGVDGAYGSGSHRTGIGGVLGTKLSPQRVFDIIAVDHSFMSLTDLTEADMWDLARFVLRATLDTDAVINTDGSFVGDVDDGGTVYDSNCAVCHGSDGLSVPPGADPGFGDYPGLIANDNPWEFLHKARFGQPGTAMIALYAEGVSLDDIAALGAYAQTLPQE